MKTAIRGFFAKLDKRTESVADDDSLLEAGIMDSLKMVELLQFIEKEYGIVVDDDDLLPENFETIDAIVGFLATRKGPGDER